MNKKRENMNSKTQEKPKYVLEKYHLDTQTNC